MPGFNINSFRSQMEFDGARPNLFNVAVDMSNLTLPNGAAAGRKISFMAKSAQLPGSTISSIPVYYFGRELKFAGNRSFANWTLTIVNDEDFIIRKAIEQWMNGINSHAGNVRASNLLSGTSYTTDGLVTQYSKSGSAIKTYRMVGMYPEDISAIDLNWESNNSIEEFSVTFAYQWWETDSTDGVGGPIPATTLGS